MIVEEMEDLLLQPSLLFLCCGINPNEVTKYSVVIEPTAELSDGLFHLIKVCHTTTLLDLLINGRKRRTQRKQKVVFI